MGEVKVIPKTNPKLSPLTLLELAVRDGADIEKLEKLMALHERWEAKEAEKAFHVAMGGFQLACPEMNATKTVSFGKTSYNFTPLDEIDRKIKQPMFDANLTKRWEVDDKSDNLIVVTCIITHKRGHRESTTMSAPPDTSGGKNTIQQRVSTSTYLKRQTLLGALGITTADKDDDARGSSKTIDQLKSEYLELIKPFIDASSDYYRKLIPENWNVEETIENYIQAIAHIKTLDLP